METKKPTRATIERRIKNAVLHIDKTKDTKSFYFSDKGLRLTVNEDYAVIETGFHRHVFSQWTMNGVSRPYLYTRLTIETAEANSEFIKTEGGYSFAKLLEYLKSEGKGEYNAMVFIDWWLFNIFQPLYSIGESEASMFLVYEDYVHNIARNSVLLDEHKEDMTNKEFIDKVIGNIRQITDELEETVLFKKKTDEEFMKENIEAAEADDLEQMVEG